MYTAEIEADLVATYLNKPDLDTVYALATKYNKPERSIISKLGALGIYKKKVYVSKSGEAPVRKAEYIERIAKLLDIDISLLDSLEKATKYALVILDERITQELECSRSHQNTQD